ncbi:hypothetical protein ABZ532_02570 [Streptomyces sp. NPDC019396]|uniref:hypothetical protein n=1 Tax=Streptomyces sp. NPDC019396 TaxID=3154687 RepID=UPI00340691A6
MPIHTEDPFTGHTAPAAGAGALTALALGVPDAPRPVASAGHNFVRWFAAAAAPYLASPLAERAGVRTPFVAAGAAALIGTVIVRAGRASLARPAHEAEPRPVATAQDGVAVLAD